MRHVLLRKGILIIGLCVLPLTLAGCPEEKDDPVCGDGVMEGGEECDDGNIDDGDGCSAVCEIEPFCGDGTTDTGEECDDGNNVDGDGCSADCLIESAVECGDGTMEGDEECDDGNVDDGDGCSAECLLEQADLTIAYDFVDPVSLDATDCAGAGMDFIDVSVWDTVATTEIAFMEGVACDDATLLFADLDFGLYNVEIDSYDASAIESFYGESLGVDHSDFAGTHLDISLEVSIL